MKRLNLALSDADMHIVQPMVDEEGTTVTAVLRRAIRTEAFLRDRQRLGCKLIIEDATGKQVQVVIL